MVPFYNAMATNVRKAMSWVIQPTVVWWPSHAETTAAEYLPSIQEMLFLPGSADGSTLEGRVSIQSPGLF